MGSQKNLWLLGLLFLISITSFSLTPNLFAAETQPSPPRDRPSEILAARKRITENPFRCDRLIRYQGKTLSCDSHLKRDGEGLRSIMQDTPSALEELDLYQQNRRKVKYAAYVGTAGVLVIATHKLIARAFVSSDPERKKERRKAEKTIQLSGLGISLGSVIYGLSYLKSNETHLTDAILRFNESHPDRPIEILLTTQF